MIPTLPVLRQAKAGNFPAWALRAGGRCGSLAVGASPVGAYTDGGCEALQFGVTIAELHVTISQKVTHGNIVSKFTFFATKQP